MCISIYVNTFVAFHLVAFLSHFHWMAHDAGCPFKMKTLSSSLRCRQAALEGGQHAGSKALKRSYISLCYRCRHVRSHSTVSDQLGRRLSYAMRCLRS